MDESIIRSLVDSDNSYHSNVLKNNSIIVFIIIILNFFVNLLD